MYEIEDKPLHQDDYGEDGRVRLEKTDMDIEQWQALPTLLRQASNVLTEANHAYGENSLNNVRSFVVDMLDCICRLQDTAEILLGRKVD